MEVTLIAKTSEKPAGLGTAICVGKDEQVIDKQTGEILPYKGLDTAIESGHFSLLEHIYFTWYIKGVSRVLSHQLVRHRIASYSQKSQRYCELDNENWYVVPKTIENNLVALDNYVRALDYIHKVYKLILSFNIPEEDARFLLPNATSTTLLVSMNGRAFVESATKRLCNKAQWEIRDMFKLMRESIKKEFPHVYKLAVPPCAKGRCTEVRPCNRPAVYNLEG